MSVTCTLCGLRYAGSSLLELHIREDHAQRDRPRDPPAGPGSPPVAPGDQAAGAAAPEPAMAGAPAEPAEPAEPAGLPGWAAAARRALNRLTHAGREAADRPRKAA